MGDRAMGANGACVNPVDGCPNIVCVWGGGGGVPIPIAV